VRPTTAHHAIMAPRKPNCSAAGADLAGRAADSSVAVRCRSIGAHLHCANGSRRGAGPAIPRRRLHIVASEAEKASGLNRPHEIRPSCLIASLTAGRAPTRFRRASMLG
jgi:hypothetical protein